MPENSQTQYDPRVRLNVTSDFKAATIEMPNGTELPVGNVVAEPGLLQQTIYVNYVPFALTGTTVETLMGQVAIPDGIMGRNSILRIEPLWSWTNNANNKTFSIKVGNAGVGGASTVYSRTRTTNQSESPVYSIANRNSLSSQVHPLASDYAVNNSNGVFTSAFDFAQTGWSLFFTGQLANASDTLTLHGCMVQVINPSV